LRLFHRGVFPEKPVFFIKRFPGKIHLGDQLGVTPGVNSEVDVRRTGPKPADRIGPWLDGFKSIFALFIGGDFSPILKIRVQFCGIAVVRMIVSSCGASLPDLHQSSGNRLAGLILYPAFNKNDPSLSSLGLVINKSEVVVFV